MHPLQRELHITVAIVAMVVGSILALLCQTGFLLALGVTGIVWCALHAMVFLTLRAIRAHWFGERRPLLEQARALLPAFPVIPIVLAEPRMVVAAPPQPVRMQQQRQPIPQPAGRRRRTMRHDDDPFE